MCLAAQAGGEVGFIAAGVCGLVAGASGRTGISRASSPLEGTRDPLEGTRALPFLKPGALLCMTGDLESPLHFPEFLFLVQVKKFPGLGRISCFWADTVEKLHFLRKLGEMFYCFFFFPKCALFPCADQTSGLGQEALCFSRKINPSAAPGRAVFSPCPVGNRVGCFTGAAAEELPSLLSFAVSLAYSVISINISFLPTHKILKLSRWPTLQRIALDYCFVLFLPLIPLISWSLCWIIVFVGNKSWRIMFKKEF